MLDRRGARSVTDAAPWCREPPVFGQLVAYVGETIIATLGGAWQMRLGANGETWEPWVVDAEGREPRSVQPRLQGAGRVGSGSLTDRRGRRLPGPSVADRALTLYVPGGLCRTIGGSWMY